MAVLIGLCLAMASPAQAAESASRPIAFTHIEAVRSPWDASAPPATGWASVALPDVWTARWPTFDGVVWYRLRWQQASDAPERALLIDYLNMAGAVYLNGTLMRSDASLVEPLTRAWNTPRYLRLPAPLLHPGENVLLVRVSGLAAYQPGLGAVTIGDPVALGQAYAHARIMRYDLQLVSLAVTATLGCFFLSLWLMRPRETAYGWFSVMSLAWWWVALNQVATSTWPFAGTHGWERANSAALLVYAAAFTMFIVRYSERRLPWIERTLWALVALGVLALALVPDSDVGVARSTLTIAQAVVFFMTCGVFLVFAWRRGRADQRVVAASVAVFFAAGLHDLLTFLGVLHDNMYYSALTAQLQMVSMALMLAWRFVATLRRVERFNDDLNAGIAQARGELAQTLTRHHELEMANARLAERVRLAHDLHDGLGGTLVSAIAEHEYASETLPSGRSLSILKELRDDLRIIIDAASSHELGEYALAAQIGSLRHRLMRLFEQQHIACSWTLEGLDGCRLSGARGLDLMRIVQEALTNVLKHSHATRAQVELRREGSALHLAIEDDGVGFDVADHAPLGAGMRSMRARAARLGGALSVESGGEGTRVRLSVPFSSEAG
ncbi:7TM diverse intracellular signaling domain-containing protein [Paraburkholderia sp. J67]|uniref:sensor histidine kinase n=1 Tax=Paraburkholderia sp. J67 TaxID=2805435 RepID=UPI002ABE6851|nr:7TM diverse intracellular signaling domain-containing protein [Paraburkholderia sp. J67]